MTVRDIYIIMGQSNALWVTWEGSWFLGDIPNWNIYDSYVYNLKNLSQSTCLGYSWWFGIEMSFADSMNKAQKSWYIAKIAFSWVGIWDDPNAVDMNFQTWEYITNITTRISRIYDRLTENGDTPNFKGVMWLHWEQDSKKSIWASKYGENLEWLINIVRTSTNTPDLKFICLDLSQKIQSHYYPYKDIVRDQIRYVANKDSNVYIISRDWLSNHDWVHYDKESMKKIWEEFARFYT